MSWKNLKKFHPVFIILTVIFLICGYGIEVLIFLLALIIHELAHAFVAKKFGYNISNFYLMPYGACLSYKDNFLEKEEILIALAGPLTNLVLSLVLIAFWWIFPASYGFTRYFVECNFYLALFNFLPCYPLDAGRILKATIKHKFSDKSAVLVTKIICYLVSSIFFILFIISCFFSINLNFLIISILLFLGVFDTIFQGKYEKIYSNKDGYLKKGIDVKHIAVNGSFSLVKAYKKMSATKYNVFYLIMDGKVRIITEDTLLNLLNNYQSNTTFGQIYTK